MIRINLLPFRAERKKENIRSQVMFFLIGLVVILLGLFYWNGILAARIEKLNKDIKKSTRLVAEYNKKAKMVEEMKRDLELLSQKMDVINSLNTNREEAFKIVHALKSSLIEKRMWFTRLEVREGAGTSKKNTRRSKKEKRAAKKKGKKGADDDADKKKINIVIEPISVQINGVALDNKTVADFMTQLEKSFTSVKLVTIFQYQLKEKNINLKKFEVVCMKKPKPKPEAGKDGTKAGQSDKKTKSKAG
jgi:type IV pilus assembly protein PilN